MNVNVGAPIIPIFLGKLSADGYLFSGGFSYCAESIAKAAGLEIIPGEYTGSAFGTSVNFIGKTTAPVFIREKKIEEVFFVAKDGEMALPVILGAAALRAFGIVIDYGQQIIKIGDLAIPFSHVDSHYITVKDATQN